MVSALWQTCGNEWHNLVLYFKDGSARTTVSFYGNEDQITHDLGDLLQKGFCKDCGDKQLRGHACRNLLFDKLNEAKQQMVCPICLESCNGATRLPCGHEFHWQCLAELYKLVNCNNCLICRKRAYRRQWDAYYIEDTDDEEEED